MRIKSYAVLVLCLALLRCSQPLKPATNAEQFAIHLSGRVLDKDGKPMPNTIAKLIGKDLSDTTDADGYYQIIEKYPVTSLNKTLSVDTLDSLQIIKEGQVITMLDVAKWIDTLPDIFVIQRDIYGNLSSKPFSISSIKAIISGDNISDSTPKIAELWYNSPNHSYSGFVYFIYTSQILHYSVYVAIYNQDTNFIGRSVKVDFPSTAGNINVPPFDPKNAEPIVDAGNDTTVSINDSIRLKATVVDSFGGKIAKWEWSINGGNFVKTSKGDTLIFAPADSNTNFKCIVRATDDDGNIAIDTVNVIICKDVPIAEAGSDTVVSLDSALVLKGNAVQNFGSIKKYFWDFNGVGIWDDSSSSTAKAKHSYNTPGKKVVIFGVMDDDNNISTDTLHVLVGTLLQGVISGNSILSKQQSPFILTGIITVPAGTQLTIEPGTDVFYTQSTAIHISGGALIANGTSKDSIYFKPFSNDTGITFLYFEKSDLSKSQLSYLNFIGSNSSLDNILAYCEEDPSQPVVAIRIGNESEFQQVTPKNSGLLGISNVHLFSSQITTDGYETSASIKIANSLIDSSMINGTYPRSEPIEIDSCSINNSVVKSDSYNQGITIIQCTGINKKLVVCCCGASVSVDGRIYSNPDNDCKSYDF